MLYWLESFNYDSLANLDTVKRRAARRDASYDTGNELSSFAKVTQRSSSFPAQVRDDDSVSGREPKVIDAVAKPRIERIELEKCRKSILQDTNDFNHNHSKLQTVEDLYWDPMGELSNFEAGEVSVSANCSANIRTESHKEVLSIDMHVLEFESSGKAFKIILKDTEIIGVSKANSSQTIVSAFMLLTGLSRLLGCSIDVFRDHFKRASDDVAFLLPSRSYIQDHVVIPYQRCYRRSSANFICEVQNKRSTFCHGNLASSEEHVTIWALRRSKKSFTSLIICDGNPKQSSDHFDISLTMRSRLENQVQELHSQELSRHISLRGPMHLQEQTCL
ncbi:uncharacterized protein Bfra_010813 [Botrytis fragariae]|uniref:Uncharacterized protein n=1 Tax=Botrytis fragariae TaxID=1964551 RepID=A0A8H6ALM3_9HELO|nr:uncharacterized protein Bfra_010813 [Botrytis fragariae]KAF5869616.1 hypothetical protein Bfra_010813 [Botrytis fragariae]